VTELWVTAEVRPEWTVLVARGKVLFDTYEPLGQALKEAVAQPGRKVVVDLDEVTVCDSSGLQLLVDTYRQLTANGGTLRLSRARSLVRRVLEITNLTTILVVFDSVEAAVSAPPSSGSEPRPGDRHSDGPRLEPR
jgi:anti-anti-sigma factor